MNSEESPKETGVPAITPSAFPAAEETIDTCWQRIGIFGDSTCTELSQVVHCRNCSVYSRAAHRLLDRPVPQEFRKEWTLHLAEKEKFVVPTRASAVVFRIQEEWLALPTEAFQEVAEQRPIHSIPHRRGSLICGLVNIRGELLVCASLGKLLGIEGAAFGDCQCADYSRFMAVIWEGSRLVFPVDEVHGIERFRWDELREPPATLAHSAVHYTQGMFVWGDKSVGLLSPDAVFSALNRSFS